MAMIGIAGFSPKQANVGPGVMMLSAICALAASAAASPPPPDTLQGLPLVYSDGFEAGLGKWEIFEPASFRLSQAGGNAFLQVPQLSGYHAPVRGPYNRVILRDFQVRDFILEARVRVTEEPFRGHRGGLFIFGYQDPSHLYYTHFAEVASDRSHLFGKVAGAPRFTFYKSRIGGVPWKMHQWQTIRMVRRFRQGILEAYVDDMSKPVMTGDDLTYRTTVNLYAETGLTIPVTSTDRFEWGRIGIGSFQGTLDYDDVRLWAETKGLPTGMAQGRDGKDKSLVPAQRRRSAYPTVAGARGQAYHADGRHAQQIDSGP